MTDLFGLKPTNYFQAFGLILLARLLVGGWHKGLVKEGRPLKAT